MARTRRGFGLTATTLAIALFGLVMATTASAALPIALATGPAVLARSVSTDTETITFAGVVNDGGEPLLYGAWGLLDDATGATLFESLVPDGVFSVDLTVTATAAGSSYTFIVAALNATGFSLDYKTVVVTKEDVECDPEDFACIVDELFVETETELLQLIDDWWATVTALVDAGDYAAADDAAKDFDKIAKDLVKDADKVAKALEKDAKASARRSRTTSRTSGSTRRSVWTATARSSRS
jgi:hypothetical protein